MKIAVACDVDGSLSAHFGRSAYFHLFEVENGRITGESRFDRPTCDENDHAHHGGGDALPPDTRALLCGGMGSGAASQFAALGIETVVVGDPSQSPRAAVEALVSGKLVRGAIHSCCHGHSH